MKLQQAGGRTGGVYECEPELAVIGRSQAMITFTLDGTVIAANPQFLQVMGYTLDEIVGRHHAMFVEPGHAETEAYRAFWAALAQGEYRTAEFKRVAKGGRDVWLQASYNPVFDSEGKPVKIVKFGTDVTAARLEAANSTGQVQAINRALAVIEFALDGTILTANQKYLSVMGYALSEIVGEHHSMFIGPAERDSPAYQAFWEALRAGEYHEGEFRRIARNGGELWLRASYNPVFDLNGKPLKIVKFATDVTPQVMIREQFRVANAELARMARHFAKARHAAEEASRAKTRFLAGMSHELRTPLNCILGYAQLLSKEGGLSTSQAKQVAAMMEAGNHLLEMISSVLDLSEIESGEPGLRVAPMGIAALAEASLSIVRAAAEKKNMDLALVIAADVPPRVMADASKLRQILLNLLGNAVKYADSGRIELCIGKADGVATPPAFTVGEPRLRFEVIDTGPGIPADRRARLFEDFERLGTEVARATEGAGLGLALSRRLAGLMQGSLTYRGNPAGGSIFMLEIPLVEDRSGVSAAGARDAGNILRTPPKGENARLLVVDDIEMNRDIASAFLKSAGYEVICAENGEEGLAAAAASDFLAVLMDVRMPVMDGLEATRRIRALPRPRSDVPIVALTAQVFSAQIAACRAAGMDTHVGKPFTLENLLGACMRAVALRSDGGSENPSARPDPGARGLATLPVLDSAVLQRTAALMNDGAMPGYLQSLAAKAEDIRTMLRKHDASEATVEYLADAAHTLSGTAEMLGFPLLAHAAKHFENAIKAQAHNSDSLAGDLESALDASLLAMRGFDLPAGQPRQVALH